MASITKRVSKTGKVSYQARARRKGYPLECKTFDSRREAKDWAAGVEGLMAQNLYVVDKDSRRLTLEEVIDAYLKERVPNLKGRQPYYQTLEWKKRPLAKRIIGHITVADIIEWIDERLNEEVGRYRRNMRGQIMYGRDGKPLPGRSRKIRPKTVLNEFTRLSAIFTWAQTELEMHALVNPCKLVPEGRRPTARGRDRRLKKGELKQILAAAKHDEELPMIGSIIVFAIETACRRAEITKLTLGDYNAEADTLDVCGTKNGDDRQIGLSPRAKQILDRIIEERGLTEPDALLFPVTPDDITHAFRRCCSATEIDGQKVTPIGGLLDFDGLTFHDLRHEGTSRLFEVGLKIQEVAHQTGHRSYQSLKRYTHPKGKTIAQKLAEAQAGGAAGDD